MGSTLNLIFARAIYFVAAFTPLVFSRFVGVVLRAPPRRFNLFLYGAVPLSWAFALLVFHPKYIQGIAAADSIKVIVPGPLFAGFAVYFALCAYPFAELILGRRRVEGFDRNRLKYTFFIFFVGYLAGLLHLWAAYTGKEPLPHDLLILFTAAVGFPIFGPPKKDFDVILRDLIVFLAWGAILGIPMSVLVWISPPGMARVLFILLGVMVTAWLTREYSPAMTELVNRLPPFRWKFVRGEEVEKGVQLVTGASGPEEWSHRVISLVRQLFGARSANVLLRDEAMGCFLVKAGYGLSSAELSFLSLSMDGPLIKRLADHGGPLVRETAGEGGRAPADELSWEMGFVHAPVSVPIFLDGKLEGVINVGPKTNGEMFNNLDLAHLENVARGAAFALRAMKSGLTHQQKTAVWAHDLVKPFGPKGSLKEVRALASGGYGEIPERARAMLGRVAEEMAFVGSNLKRLIHPNAEEQYNIQQTSLTGVYGRVRDRFQGLAGEKGIDWRVSVPPDDIKVLCDERMIEHRVIGNLVENAIRHTPLGGVVELGYRMEGNSFNGYVKDSGLGIHPEDKLKIFHPGVQLEITSKGQAGLGLHSVKSVIESHCGKVRVESAPGQGSCFMFELPIGMKV